MVRTLMSLQLGGNPNTINQLNPLLIVPSNPKQCANKISYKSSQFVYDSESDCNNTQNDHDHDHDQESQIVGCLMVEFLNGNDSNENENGDRNRKNKKMIEIIKGEFLTAGRSSSCGFRLCHPSISSQHFEIHTTQFDTTSEVLVYCTDKSLNGTFHNNRIIGKNKCVLLTNSDTLSVPKFFKAKFHQYDLSELNSQLIKQEINLKINYKEEEILFSKYKLSNRLLGLGTFGKVLMVTNILTNEQSACKIIDLGIDQEDLSLIKEENDLHLEEIINNDNSIPKSGKLKAIDEALILRNLSHPNIISVFDTFRKGKKLISGGDLFSYLTKGSCLIALEEREAIVIIYQILKALEYLHEKNIAHRDLKLDNVLLTSQHPASRIVLADFGIAKFLEIDQDNNKLQHCSGNNNKLNKLRMNTVVGTPEYCAPEVGFGIPKLKRNGYNLACDMWSLGVITHILLSGISPFYANGKESEIVENAKIGNLEFNKIQWGKVSKDAKDFVKQLIVVNPNLRMNVKESLNHKWIKNHKKDLEEIYQENVLKKENLIAE